MKKSLCIVFLYFSIFQVSAQNRAKIDSVLEVLETASSEIEKVDGLVLVAKEYSRTDPDKAILYANKAIEIANKNNYLKGVSDGYYGIGWVLMRKGEYDSATSVFKNAIDYAKKAEYNKGIANAQNGLGIINRNQGHLDKALAYYNSSFNIFKSINDKVGLSSSHNSLAIVYHIKGDIKKAIEHFTYSLEIDLELGDSVSIASSYNNLGRVHHDQGNFPEALNFYFKSLALKESFNDQRGMAGSYMNVGTILKDQSKWEESLHYLLKALAIQEELKDKRYIGANYSNIGSIYKEIKQDSLAINYYQKAIRVQTEIGDKLGLLRSNLLLGECYSNLNENKKALKYLEEAIRFGEEVEAKSDLSAVYNAIGKVHWRLNRIDLAKKNLNKGIAMAKEANFPTQIRDGLFTLSLVEKASGNYQAALEFYELYHTYYDSLLGEEKSKQLAQLEVQYETEKKEQEIENLAQNATIQSLKLAQTNSRMMILGVLLVLVISIGVILLLVNRQKQYLLNQKAHDMEQRLLRVQMNPHFIFNAMSAIQDYMMKGDAKQAALYLTKFSKLVRQVLDNSRSEFIHLDQEISMLDNYISLQNLRRDRPFEYELIVDDELDPEEVSIPPMFAQPFVENSIEHGMAKIEEGGFVKIHFSIKEDFLTLKIEDNGEGIEESLKVKRKDGHISHATQITRERIELFKRITKKDILFRINKLAQGSEVEFNLPYQIT